MGNDDDKEKSPIKANINNESSKFKDDIIVELNKLIEQEFELFEKESKECKIKVKTNILNKIQKKIEHLLSTISKDIKEKIFQNHPKKKIIFEPFIPYEINEEYKKILIDIKNKSRKDYIEKFEDEEESENQALGTFLKKVGIISRNAFNESIRILQKLHEEFKQKELELSRDDDFIRYEFSSWVKEKEKENEKDEFYKKYFGNIELNKNNILEYENEKKEEGEIKFLTEIFKKLTILFIHCNLSFPVVKIIFQIKDGKLEFSHESMEDWFGDGVRRKVNFIFLPGLISCGNYLQSGKCNVFTYQDKKRKTFYFEDIDLDKNLKKDEFKINNMIILRPDIKDNLIKIYPDYNIAKNTQGWIYRFEFIKKENINYIIQKQGKDETIEIPDETVFYRCQLVYQNKIIGNYEKKNK